MHITRENGVHDPCFKVLPFSAMNRPNMGYPDKDSAAYEIGKCYDLLCQLLGTDAIQLEFHAGIFTVADYFNEFRFQQGLIPQDFQAAATRY